MATQSTLSKMSAPTIPTKAEGSAANENGAIVLKQKYPTHRISVIPLSISDSVGWVRGKKTREDHKLRMLLILHMDGEYNAHPELRIEIVRTEKSVKNNETTFAATSVHFSNYSHIRYERIEAESERSKELGQEHKILENAANYNHLTKLTVRSRAEPWFENYPSRATAVPEDLRNKMHAFIKDITSIRQKEPQMLFFDLYCYKGPLTKSGDSTVLAKDVATLNALMTTESQICILPWKKLHRDHQGVVLDKPAFSTVHMTPRRFRPSLFWMTEEGPSPGKTIFRDAFEYITLQVYAQVFEYEATMKIRHQLEAKPLNLFTIREPNDTLSLQFLCFIENAPVELAVGEALEVKFVDAINEIPWTATVSAPTSLTPRNGFTTLVLHRPFNSAKGIFVPIPQDFNVHPTRITDAAQARQQFSQVPVNLSTVSFAIPPVTYTRQVQTAQTLLDDLQAGKLGLKQWMNVLTGQNVTARGTIKLFAGLEKFPDFAERKRLVPLTAATADLHDRLDNMVSGIQVVEGPPGTGKSYLLARILLVLLVDPKARILAVAPTNVACDVIVKKTNGAVKEMPISRAPKIVRLYSSGTEQELFESLSNSQKVQASRAGADETEVQMMAEYLSQKKKRIDATLIGESFSQHILQEAGLFKRADDKLTDAQQQFQHLFRQKINNPSGMSNNDATKYDTLLSTFKQRVVETANLIVATPHAGSERIVVQHFNCQTLFFDEAGKMNETDSMNIIGLHLPRAMLLFGDTLQLKPYASTGEDNPYRAQVLTTLMHRVQTLSLQPIALKLQFRQAAGNFALTSKHFYGNSLEDAVSSTGIDKRPIAKWFCAFWESTIGQNYLDRKSTMRQNSNPQIFADVNGVAVPDPNKSLYNEANVAFTLYLLTLMKAQFWRHNKDSTKSGDQLTFSSISIQVPYRAQKVLYKEAIEQLITFTDDKSLRDIQIKTTDEFQGEENNIIIYDTVGTGGRGHFMDRHRSNVGFSRARDGLVVIGNLAGLQGGTKAVSDDLRRHTVIIEYFKAKGNYVNFPATAPRYRDMVSKSRRDTTFEFDTRTSNALKAREIQAAERKMGQMQLH